MREAMLVGTANRRLKSPIGFYIALISHQPGLTFQRAGVILSLAPQLRGATFLTRQRHGAQGVNNTTDATHPIPGLTGGWGLTGHSTIFQVDHPSRPPILWTG